MTGTNKFELLLFRLGGDRHAERNELFGINVFKIGEIVAMPEVTAVARSRPHVLGVAHLRGAIIQVLDLPAIAGCLPATGLNIMLVTEFARTTQAFAVESVEEIVRLDWNCVMSAERSTGGGTLVASIARLDDDVGGARLVQVLDLETILHNLAPPERPDSPPGASGPAIRLKPGALIEQGLDAIGLPCLMTRTGKQAWEQLQRIADQAEAEGHTVYDKVAMVLTDLEMPEMDGFTLTRRIKQSLRFNHLPVVIHSSLSGTTSEEHVRSVGADAYVAKFSAEDLANAIRTVLGA